MPTSRFLQATFASGEFDPLLASREDVAFYYSSAKLLSNVVPLPQGGVKRREGLKAIGKQRGILTAFVVGGATETAPNGGTAANNDSDDPATTLLTTGEIGTDTVYVVFHVDFAAATRVSLADVTARLVGGTITTGTLALQSSDDDSAWTTRAELVIGTTFYARRWAQAPDTDLGTHRYWRIALLNPDADDYGTDEVELYGVKWWVEDGQSQTSATPGNVRLEKVTASIEREYFVVMTAFNADLYGCDGSWQAAAPIPHDDDEVPEIKVSQNLDTMILYQKDHPPHVIQRLDSICSRWRGGPFQFEDVAQFPFADSTTGGQNEIQYIRFASMSSGDRFVLEYNGDITDEIQWNGTMATNLSNITTQLEGLEDISSVTCTEGGTNDVIVEFDGADANTFFATLIVDILTGSGTATVSRTQFGRPNQEDLWSATRGYPRCGTFYQGRHWMGGFRSRPDVIVGSRVGNFAEFKEDADPISTSPLVLAPDIDEQVTVENIYPGRNLQIFTSAAELYIPVEPITPDTVALKVTSKRGHAERTQPVDVQGGTLFLDRNGTNLREYLFSEAEQSYTAEPVSTLGGHLVQDPVDMALRRSNDTDEPTILYVVNTGRDRNFAKVPGASITIDRAQQVTSFARIATFGELKAVAASQAGEVAFVTRRALAGNAWNYLETLDAARMSDHSSMIENAEIDEFTATASQTVFTYTFTNPSEDTDIAMFTREDSSAAWTRVEPGDYTLDTGAKTITLDTGATAGDLYAICKRQTSFSTGAPELDGIECYVHADGRPVGEHTPSAGSVTIAGDEGFFFEAEIGIRMVPDVILQAFKGQGGMSPTMQRQRIFRALLNLERTSHAAIGMETSSPRAIALTDYDADVWDQDLEEILFTGVKRVSGLGRWELEPRLRITQTEPGPFLLRSVSYDIRY